MKSFKRVLAVETSCDDTSVAVVEHGGKVLYSQSLNQDLAHRPFGGIVPELAGRNHSQNLVPLIDQALKSTSLDWKNIDGLVVTNRPGLVGSLLVGVVTVKSLAWTLNKPFVGVNHLEGHILAGFLNDDEYTVPVAFGYPYLALAVSGGHTSLYHVKSFGNYEVLGKTIDDAAGEAFDKFAKMLGLGFPGGVQIDKHSQKGSKNFHSFPRGMLSHDSLDFSFSGLKTAGLRKLESMSTEDIKSELYNLCASYQEAIVDTLVTKLDRAYEKTKIKNILITGGVSANSRLRSAGSEWADRRKLNLIVPPLRYCTDNAAMIGYAGMERLNRGEFSDLSLGVSPVVSI